MPIDVLPYLRALEEFTGFKLGEPCDEVHEFVVDDVQSVAIAFDGEGGVARIVSLVDNASNRLSDALLARLLEFNFPNNSTAGATLCAMNGTTNLKLVNQFPLSAIAPKALAATALAQGRAAIGLTKWIVEQRAQNA